MTFDDHVDEAAPIGPGGIERSPPGLLKEPLEFLFAEHFRHRQMCKILEYLAGAPVFDPTMIIATDDFIRDDLAFHVSDEEEDLFPLLRKRCAPEDDIEDVLGRLSADHALDRELARAARAVFANALETHTAASTLPGGPQALLALARQQKDHMALENAVIMPLARRRLQPADLEILSARLAARRGA